MSLGGEAVDSIGQNIMAPSENAQSLAMTQATSIARKQSKIIQDCRVARAKDNRKRRLAGQPELDNDADFEAVRIDRSKRRNLQFSTRTSRMKPGVRTNKAALEIVGYENTSMPIIAKAPFLRLIGQLVRDTRHDYRIQSSAVTAFQIASETYVTTFLAAANLAARHAGRVTIMDKDFTHVRRIGFLLGATKDNPDQEATLAVNKIISAYSHGKETPDLTDAQKNRIDAILTIRDFDDTNYDEDEDPDVETSESESSEDSYSPNQEEIDRELGWLKTMTMDGQVIEIA